MPITPEWLAGFFDGEGCVTVVKARKSNFTPVVTFTNTDLETLQVIQRQYGGTLHFKGERRGWNKGYMLKFAGAGAARRILVVIQPFLITKKREVDFFLTAWFSTFEGRRGKKISPEQLEIREQIKSQLSAMKLRNTLTKTIN